MKPKLFHSAFASCLLAVCGPRVTRVLGNVPTYVSETPAGLVSFFFEPNPKWSSLPGWAGEFRPVITAASLRHNACDDGSVSWYQFTDEALIEAMHAQQQSALQKVSAQARPKRQRSGEDAAQAALLASAARTCLNMMRSSMAQPFEARLPHAGLYYFDEADASAWGSLFGRCLGAWLERWDAAPETLEAYMWRVHWKDLPRGA